MSLTLYGRARSPYSARCRMVVYAKSLDVTLVDLDEAPTAPDKWTLNPAGKIPILLAGDHAIVESDVICEYLEEKFPDPAMLPEHPAERAQVRSLARFSDEYVLKRALALLRFVRQERPNREQIEADLASLDQGLRWLQELMPEKSRYMAGDMLSLADSIAVPSLYAVTTFCRILAVRDALIDFAKITCYWNTVREHDAAAAVVQEMHRSLQTFFPMLR